MTAMSNALLAKSKAREMLRGLPGINGVGITWDDQGRPCVRVNVDLSMERADRSLIPSSIDQVPVIVEVTTQAALD